MKKALIATLVVLALALSAGFWPEPSSPRQHSVAAAGLLAQLLDTEIEGFASVEQPWTFKFPADHGPHPAYRSETWGVSGTLASDAERRFGFHLAIFRVGVNPPQSFLGPSTWAAHHVYAGRFTLTDVATGQVQAFEGLSRAAMGLSGAQASPVRVWLGQWTLSAQGDVLTVRAAERDLELELTLHSVKPPVPGDADAFHSYLMSRFQAEGTVRMGAQQHEVKGLAWLDRAWGAVPVPIGAVVWDRVLVQLEDGRELMVLRLRRRDGSGKPVVSGLLVERQGSARPIAREGLTAEPLTFWHAPDGRRYPNHWRVHIPGEAIELDLAADVPEPKLQGSLFYWAAPGSATGKENGLLLRGSAHLESAGYSDGSPDR